MCDCSVQYTVVKFLHHFARSHQPHSNMRSLLILGVSLVALWCTAQPALAIDCPTGQYSCGTLYSSCCPCTEMGANCKDCSALSSCCTSCTEDFYTGCNCKDYISTQYFDAWDGLICLNPPTSTPVNPASISEMQYNGETLVICCPEFADILNTNFNGDSWTGVCKCEDGETCKQVGLSATA